MTVAEIKEFIDKIANDYTSGLKNEFDVARELFEIKSMLDQLDESILQRTDQTLNFYRATKNSNIKSVKTDVIIIDLENLKKGLGYDNTRD